MSDREYRKDPDEKFSSFITEALTMIREKAGSMGGNAVVGMEIHVNPWASENEIDGISLWITGTCARIVPLL